jgi:hypothetical protein
MEGDSWEERYAGMVMGLMRFSVVAWTFRDEDGPIPVTLSNVDKMLPWLKGGKEVAAAVTDLFQADILTPFVEAFNSRRKKTRKKSSSRNGSTDTSSTSPTPISQDSTPTP